MAARIGKPLSFQGFSRFLVEKFPHHSFELKLRKQFEGSFAVGFTKDQSL
jgi:hypothetical protein